LVLASAGITIPLVAVLVVPMPVWAGLPTPAPALSDTADSALGWLGVVATLGLLALLCLPYRLYVLALRVATGVVSTRLLICLTVIVAAVGLLAYPRFGSDVFDYAAYERMWVFYGDNP